jgi:hypothetical protein
VELDTNTATSGAGGALAVDVATDLFNISGSIFGGNAAFTDGGAVSLHAFSPNATTTISKGDFEVPRQMAALKAAVVCLNRLPAAVGHRLWHDIRVRSSADGSATSHTALSVRLLLAAAALQSQLCSAHAHGAVAAVLQGNQAQQLGGGLAMSESPGARVVLRSGTFTENAAALGGGLHADNETEASHALSSSRPVTTCRTKPTLGMP